MSFTDPFNRVSCKRDKEYLVFHDQLTQAGIDTEEKAREVMQKSRNSMLGAAAVVIAAALLISLIWSNLAGIAFVFGCLILLWLLVTMSRGQRMMRQFIKQEFGIKSSIDSNKVSTSD